MILSITPELLQEHYSDVAIGFMNRQIDFVDGFLKAEFKDGIEPILFQRENGIFDDWNDERLNTKDLKVWVEIPYLDLFDEVPENMPDRELNEDVRTWQTYATQYIYSLDNSSVLLYCGHYPNGINRMDETIHTELSEWFKCFAKSQFLTLKKSEQHNETIEYWMSENKVTKSFITAMNKEPLKIWMNEREIEYPVNATVAVLESIVFDKYNLEEV